MTGDVRDRRGVTPVVAVVLLVGLVAVGSITIVLVGSSVVDGGQGEVETSRIGQSFLELGEQVNTISRTDNGSTRTIDLDLPSDGSSAVRRQNAGTIWVNRTNFETGNTTLLVREDIGAIRYEADDTTYAYQAGAVFSLLDNGTQLESSPLFQYTVNQTGERPTLTVPIVTTVGANRLPNGEVTAEKRSTETPLNNRTVIQGALVSITVQSDWYVGWAQYFRALAAETGTADTAVTVNHTRETATLRLFSPESRESLKGIVSGSAAGQVRFANQVEIQSYNSSKCPYGCAAATEDDGDVYVAGNLTLSNKPNINGSVFVGKTLRFDSGVSTAACDGKTNKYVVCGDANYGSLVNDSSKSVGDLVGGTASPGASVPSYDAVDSVIDGKVSDAKSNNDNGDVGAVVGDRLDCDGGGSCTLPSGTYYLDRIDGDSDLKGTLALNATSGPIEIVVDGPVNVEKTDINVTGGRVDVFVDSDRSGPCDTSGGGTGCDFDWGKDSNVYVQNDSGGVTDDASNFWVFMDSSSDATFRTAGGGKPEFTGVLFGPGQGSDPGVNVSIGQGNIIQGTVVGNISNVEQKVQFRYDRSLRRSTVIVSDIQVPKVTYLVVTNYVVEVEDD